jgi:hypothetical protein
MIASPESTPAPRVSRARLVWFASVVFCGVLPAVALIGLFVASIQDDVVALDFGQFYAAAEAILAGSTIYPDAGPATVWGGPYPYPPLPALLAVPFTVLPYGTAGLVVMALLVVCAAGTLYVLGIRDWRCYGIALFWPPVLSAVQTGNVTLVLALGCALVWKYRDRAVPGSTALGGMLAVKFFLWPLLVWMAATRRVAMAALAAAVGAGLLLLSWAIIGFDGLTGYSARLQRLESFFGEDSYTVYIAGLDAGLPSGVARAVWLLVGFGLLAAVAVVARRGHEQAAFILAIAAALSLTPIVWLHYFALLVVVVALAQPRLGILWFVPFGMIFSEGTGHPRPFETSVTLAVAATTIALAVHFAWTGDVRAVRPTSTSPARA